MWGPDRPPWAVSDPGLVVYPVKPSARMTLLVMYPDSFEEAEAARKAVVSQRLTVTSRSGDEVLVPVVLHQPGDTSRAQSQLTRFHSSRPAPGTRDT